MFTQWNGTREKNACFYAVKWNARKTLVLRSEMERTKNACFTQWNGTRENMFYAVKWNARKRLFYAVRWNARKTLV